MCIRDRELVDRDLSVDDVLLIWLLICSYLSARFLRNVFLSAVELAERHIGSGVLRQGGSRRVRLHAPASTHGRCQAHRQARFAPALTVKLTAAITALPGVTWCYLGVTYNISTAYPAQRVILLTLPPL